MTIVLIILILIRHVPSTPRQLFRVQFRTNLWIPVVKGEGNHILVLSLVLMHPRATLAPMLRASALIIYITIPSQNSNPFSQTMWPTDAVE